MNKTSWILAIIGLIVILLIRYGISIPITVKQYVVNTYMYILLAMVLCSAELFALEKYDEKYFEFYDNALKYVSIIILTFVSMFTVLLVSKDKQLLKHIAWTLFVLCIGFLAYPAFKELRENNQINTILTTLIIVIIGFSWIAYNRPIGTFESWGSILFSLLAGLLIYESVDAIFFRNKTNELSFNRRTKIYSWIAIALFTAYLMHDTQKLNINAIEAIKSINDGVPYVADYPAESLGIFLDITNLFVNTTNIASE